MNLIELENQILGNESLISISGPEDIDMRQTYFEDWIQDEGFGTTDGVHPNDRGATMEAGLFFLNRSFSN